MDRYAPVELVFDSTSWRGSGSIDRTYAPSARIYIHASSSMLTLAAMGTNRSTSAPRTSLGRVFSITAI